MSDLNRILRITTLRISVSAAYSDCCPNTNRENSTWWQLVGARWCRGHHQVTQDPFDTWPPGDIRQVAAEVL